MANNLDDESISVIQETVTRVNKSGLFSEKHGEAKSTHLQGSSTFLRGYLMQGVSNGQSALCHLFTRRPEYRMFKIDLAGIIYEHTDPELDGRFQLRFKKGTVDANGVVTFDTWFDTAILPITDLVIGKLLDAVVTASVDPVTMAAKIPMKTLTGALGHPISATNMVFNDELYPEKPEDYHQGDMIHSNIGSWIFGIHRSVLPEEFDIDLLFSTDADNPVQLSGPAVMTLYEIADTPTNSFITVYDAMDVAAPTPLRGGTKVLLAPFDDMGYGIISANPREYLFTQKVSE